MNLGLDETLLHFAQITGHIDAEEVLRRARKLVYNVITRDTLPCYISEIVAGFTDATGEMYMPEVNCIGHLNGRACIFGQKSVRDKKLEKTQEQIRAVWERVMTTSNQVMGSLTSSFRGFFSRASNENKPQTLMNNHLVQNTTQSFEPVSKE